MGRAHADLVHIACRWLAKTKRCALVFAEAGKNVCVEEPDALGFRQGAVVSHVVECKVSRADFSADARKPAAARGARMGMYRWYLVPDGLVRADEVPGGWGLLYAAGRGVRLVVEAPAHHGDRDLRSELTWLYCATRRHQLRVEWRSGQYRFAPVTKARAAP